MNKTTKVAISLPEHILKAIEEERRTKGESRSEFFRRAAEILLKQARESKQVDRYVQGYRAMPEATDEIETAHRQGISVLAEEPW